MCGISGIFKSKNEFITIEEINNFSKVLNHRGPDFTGTYIQQNIAFNLLKIHGIEKTLELIEGMFAFAWHSKTRNDLFLVRDRLGIKPLYYSKIQNHFYFSSEIKAIWKNLPVNLNHSKVLDSFYGGSETNRYHTIFENIYSIQPGCFLSINTQLDIKENCYYNIFNEFDNDVYKQTKSKSRDYFQQEFNSLISDSVKNILVSDAHLVTLASGGIDSALITYLASKNQKIDIYSSDIVEHFSELEAVKLLSKSTQSDLYVDSYYKKDYLENITACTWFNENPIISYSNSVPFSQIAKKAKHDGVKVALTGEGSDELFLGYPKAHFERLANKVLLPYNIISKLYNKVPGISKYLNQYDPSGKDIFVHLLNRNFDRQESREDFSKKHSFSSKNESEYIFNSLNLMTEHLVGLLHRNDRMGMMNSIEARFPFLNEKLVKFAINIPYNYKYQIIPKFYNKKHPFLLDKSLVRNCVKNKLPDDLIYKNKWGFGQNIPSLVQYKKGTFSTGYLREILGTDSKTEDYIINKSSPYLLSKLFSIEVFGRLYGLRNSIEETNDWVQRVAYF
ncbi:MAG: hypothetical protein HYZ42_18005 [Bacteroidetes bacterium]|nr:hypothetical protein [Bacteroidota bacterium]